MRMRIRLRMRMRMRMRTRLRMRMRMRMKIINLVFLITYKTFVIPFENSNIVSFDFSRT